MSNTSFNFAEEIEDYRVGTQNVGQEIKKSSNRAILTSVVCPGQLFHFLCNILHTQSVGRLTTEMAKKLCPGNRSCGQRRPGLEITQPCTNFLGHLCRNLFKIKSLQNWKMPHCRIHGAASWTSPARRETSTTRATRWAGSRWRSIRPAAKAATRSQS